MGRKVRQLTAMLMICLLLIGIIPQTYFDVNANSVRNNTMQAATEDNLTIKGTNNFGKMLASDISDEEQDYMDESCYVSDLVVEGKIATVSFCTNTNGDLVVAIYDEDSMKMTASGTVSVKMDELTANVSLEGDIPENFVASAYLLDAEKHYPLSKEFTTHLYTKEVQQLKNSTVADYDESQVVNLDGDETTNFGVVKEETISTKQSGDTNDITDNNNGTYTFSQPNSSISSLKSGDALVYTDNDGNIYLIKVSSVRNEEDGDIVITENADADLSDFFAQLKIETSSEGGKVEYDTSTMAEGVTMTKNLLSKGNPGDVTAKNSASYNINFKSVGGQYNNVTIKGSLTFEFSMNLKFYLSWSYKYVSLVCDTKSEIGVNVSGTIQLRLPLAKGMITPPLPGIVCVYQPSFVVRGNGSFGWKLSYKATLGMAYDSDVGFVNKCSAPKIESKVDFSGTVFVGVQCECNCTLFDKDKANVGLVAEAGAESKAKLKSQEISTEGSKQHTCKNCIEGTVSGKISGSASAKLGNLVNSKVSIVDVSAKAFDFYYSIDHSEFGMNIKCPHIAYKVTLTVKDENGNLVPNAKVSGTGLQNVPMTDNKGKAEFFLVNGEYELFIDDGTRNAYQAITILDNAKQLEITLKKEYMSWNMTDDGVLTVWGKGPMNNYSFSNWYDRPPWYQNVKEAIILDGVTTIGKAAFESCYDLKNVTLPDSIKEIDYCGFNHCWSLESITIPDGVTYIGDYAFIACRTLEELYIPDSVTSMGQKPFCGCISLKTLRLPESTTYLTDEEFQECSSLESFTIPEGVKRIPLRAFEGCSSLSSITIPNNVYEIYNYAFNGCSSLTSIYLPAGLSHIGINVFDGCTSLTDVFYQGSEEDWAKIQLDYGNDNLLKATIHYNYASKKNGVLNSLPSDELDEDEFSEEGSSETTQDISENLPKENREKQDSEESIDILNNQEVEDISNNGEDDQIQSDPSQIEEEKEDVIEDELEDTSGNIFPKMKQFLGNSLLSMEVSAASQSEEESSDDASLTSYKGSISGNEAVFEGLRPEMIYVYIAVKDPSVDDLLNPSNLLYIEQKTADNEGKARFRYKPRSDESATVLAYGRYGITIQDISQDRDSFVYNGEVQGPTVSVEIGGKDLVEGKDYILYGDPTASDSGDYSFWLKGKGIFGGTIKLVYRIEPVSLANSHISLSKTTFTYTGKEITPEPVLTYSDKTLEKGRDYTLSYHDNINEGTARMIIAGKGDYTGTVEISFKIVKSKQDTSVKINKTNFPDSKFCKYVSSKFDKNKDGSLSQAEINKIQEIDVTSLGVSSLKGIEVFKKLTTLWCYGNKKLTSLDISKNTALEYLDCWDCPIKSLNIKNSPALVKCYKSGQIYLSSNHVEFYILAKNMGLNVNRSTKITPAVSKRSNPIRIKGKTVSVKYSKTKKKTQNLTITKYIKTPKAQGRITFTKLSGNKKILINKKTRKLVLKKGLKRGKYKIKVRVLAAGNKYFKAKSKTMILKIRVK